MSDESDFRNVLARAAEGGAFDDCCEDLPGYPWETWYDRCLARAREIAPPPDGLAIAYVELTALPNGHLVPKFVVVPENRPVQSDGTDVQRNYREGDLPEENEK
jgi:hypothetical protein